MRPRSERLRSVHGALVVCAVAVSVVGMFRAGGVAEAASGPVRDVISGLVRQDRSLRPGCRLAFRARTAAAWCDPSDRGVARLRSRGRKLRRIAGTHVVRLAGLPLPVGQRVRIRASSSGRRAQLAVVVQDGSSLTYARFTGIRRRRLVATVHSRGAGAALVIRLSARRRRWRPVVQRTGRLPAPAPAPAPAPPPPAATPRPSAPPRSRLVIRECGSVAPATAEDVDAFNQLWGTDRSGPGWTGGDVTFSTPLPDGRAAWIFGDTFIDHVTPGGRRTGGLVRNAIVVQEGPCLTTYAAGTPGAPDALLRPVAPDEWYWPADATVEGDDHLHVLAWRVRRTGPGAWDFAVVGTDLVTLALGDLAERAIRPLPAAPGVAWGTAIIEDGGRTHVYGVHVHADGTPYLHIARTTTDLEGPWEYRTADGGWSLDPEASADQLPGISHQISVVREGESYFLITQDPGLGADIVLHRAATPAGPWTQPGEPVATAPPPLPGTFTYNAVAHPEYTAGGRLLLSYNVNSVVPDAALVDASIYRPRFITVPWPPAP